ncbi:energy transducer TonB [Hymenobacter oligotrophus]|uniref:Energy transducer TonB n=1 Tax=Hymenobacter oligotrophus TaxID=2319843 RepID=A0A3B7R353_9BACT|nr:energy transducer TonB [Hymenobacter oligotrophus]AYA37760.1 energy transducer TonB [Hymenobacter oligotrophus]
MLQALPITNVRLQPCAVAADKLTPVPGGHFCADCQRVVHDFTNATQLELAEARAASPDGRLCGRFRQAQLAAAPRLRPKLRWCLAALVLVVVESLSAQQAWAQVRQKARTITQKSAAKHLHHKHTKEEETLGIELSGLGDEASELHGNAPTAVKAQQEEHVYGVMLEQMPQFKGGHEALFTYLRSNLRYPSTTASSRVFVSFLVTKTGAIKDARVVKGTDPALDAEALRVVGQMPNWVPAYRNGQPIEAGFTIPITFDNKK